MKSLGARNNLFRACLPRLLLSLLASFSLLPVAQAQPEIAIIIDDLGNNLKAGLQVTHLPGPVACSILPDRPFSRIIARNAHHHGKEILVHTPMEALKPHRLGVGGLRVKMSKAEFLTTLRRDLASLPFIDGVNNHMGSLLTQKLSQMNWLMDELHRLHLYFIDSRTTQDSVAEYAALTAQVPTSQRDVFLDVVATKQGVQRQFKTLLSIAKKQGSAIAIGHPNSATIKVLKKQLPLLADAGIQLVPVRSLIQEQTLKRLNGAH